MKKQFLGAPIFWHWIYFLVSLLMTVEYARLVLTTDVPPYKTYILGIWGILLILSSVRIVVPRKKAAYEPAA